MIGIANNHALKTEREIDIDMAFTEMDFTKGGGGSLTEIVYPSVSGTYDTYAITNMFDGNDSTFWIGNAETSYVYLYNLASQNIAKIKLRTSYFYSRDYTMNIVVYGSNTSTSADLVQLATLSPKYSDGVKEIAVNSSYKYYVIKITNTVSGNYAGLSRLMIE